MRDRLILPGDVDDLVADGEPRMVQVQLAREALDVGELVAPVREENGLRVVKALFRLEAFAPARGLHDGDLVLRQRLDHERL